MKRLFFVFLILIIAISTHIAASPTIYGPSGLITIPTAESVSFKEMNLGVDLMSTNGDGDDSWLYKMNLGTFQNWELGFVGGKVPTEGVFINAKYYLMSNNERFPVSIAIGLERLTSETDTGVYMVASKKFQGGLNGHIGFRAIFGPDELDPSIMGGVEYIVSNQISLLADFSGERKVYTVNAGLNYYINPEFIVRFAVLDFMNSKESVYYSVGTSYSLFL
jgi:hypothetical protein